MIYTYNAERLYSPSADMLIGPDSRINALLILIHEVIKKISIGMDIPSCFA